MFKVSKKYQQILLKEIIKSQATPLFPHSRKIPGHVIEGLKITPLKSQINAVIKLQQSSNQSKSKNSLEC